MAVFFGSLIVILTIWGGYALSGGSAGIFFQPAELLIISGAASGAFLAANSGKAILTSFRLLTMLFRSSRYNRELSLNVLGLLFQLLRRVRQDGILSIEKDTATPLTSPIFRNYPLVVADKMTMDFITDYTRLMLSGNMNAQQTDALMGQEIETLEEEGEVPVHALDRVADSLPAFGIVAAVLGVIHALGSADRPAGELGELIAQAMVGTFLGITLSYGFISPLAKRLQQRHAESVRMLQCIRMIFIAHLNGYPPQIAVEFGRKALYSSVRPSFSELEEILQAQIKGTFSAIA